MTTYTLADLEAAAPRVLERLRALADLPAYGTVAGQAVASLFWEELGHAARGPVNDIDVFVNAGLPRTLRGLEEIPEGQPYQQRRQVVPTAVKFGDVVVSDDHYAHVKFIAMRATVQILRTYQVGLVNYTLVRNPAMAQGEFGHRVGTSREIVSGFDLNLVGVGINLESGEVAASPGFLEFLNCAQIRVETCNTPAHTLMRLASKAFGGQITGATCDYEQERNLLEVALACQGSQPQHGHMCAVTDFGGGKYKALHDRYADVLPPCAPREVLVPNGSGSSYVLYSLCPPAPTNDVDLAIIEGARRQCVDKPFVGQEMYVAQFPRIYELSHPERSLLPPEELAVRRASLDAMDDALSHGTNISFLQRALGRPAAVLPMPGWDDEDVAVFFFGQSCAKTTASAQAAVTALEAINDAERWMVGSLECKADAVVALHQDRDNAWKTLLRQHGVEVILALRRFGNQEPGLAAVAMGEVLGWMEEMGEAGTRLAHELVPCYKKGGEKLRLFQQVVTLFTGTERSAAAERLMTWVAPAWPALAGETRDVRCIAMAQWATTGQPVPKEFWDAAPPEDLPYLIEISCATLQPFVKTNGDVRAQMAAILAEGLPRLTVEQLAREDCLALRAALVVGGFAEVSASLLARPASAELDAVLAGLAEELRVALPLRTVQAWGDDDDGDKDEWRRFPQREVALATIEEVLLERSVATPVAAEGLGRGRGMRM